MEGNAAQKKKKTRLMSNSQSAGGVAFLKGRTRWGIPRIPKEKKGEALKKGEKW